MKLFDCRKYWDSLANVMMDPQKMFKIGIDGHPAHVMGAAPNILTDNNENVCHKPIEAPRFQIKIQNTMEDQLSLASIHYMRMHYTEAIEIYKSILQEHT
ncbi:hypothetical protein KIN20_020150 [Parelaphostrongylus tenuis]|uniref:Uncharacterized protein n=1 Tax=Parelaphostrongylus tenuis TaxID=148309 RepID=A0AAD5N665_PARTN|nr:hypothetical protein KIN20_020150 [Parelaphostrongylus tenuis]